jgi:hypothetical protein
VTSTGAVTWTTCPSSLITKPFMVFLLISKVWGPG